MSVGVKASDEDHKKLMNMLNRLHDAMRIRQGKEVVGKVLEELVSYTKFHFAREEAFFSKSGYPEAAEHVRQHQELVKQAEALQTRYKSGEGTLSIETLDFLKDWLTIHIRVTDKKYTNHLNAAGIR